MSQRSKTLDAALVDAERRVGGGKPPGREPAGTVSGALRERAWTPFVHQRFARQARTRPEKIAVWYGSRQLSYGELEARSNRLAHFLRKQGVGPEVLVGVCTDRTPERVIGIVAILKAGGAFVSFDPDYPRERLEYLVADARTPVLLTELSCLDRLPRTSARIVCLDRDLEDLEGDESAPPRVDLDPENLAYVVYTSGSTGKPKGVAVPHRGLLNLAHWQNERYQMSPADRGGLVASPAFDASLFELWPFLMAGAGLAIPDEETRLSASRTLRWWAQLGITVAFLPTPLAEVLLESEVPPGLDLRVRVLTIGGDRLRKAPPPETRFELSNVYGPAEASVATTEGVVPPQARGAVAPSPISIGRPIDNMRVHFLDPDLDPVASGEIGEVFVSGDGLARGYQGRPDLTAERFLPNPFGGLRGEAGARMYRTGDLASLRSDGDLDFLGRIDHQVKIRGMRVELGEIESVLASLPGVRDAVVLAGEGKGDSARLVAYFVPFEGEDGLVRESKLRGALAATLPEYMIPSAFVRVASFPLTPNGKVDRRALAELEVSAETGTSALAPRTEMEEALRSVFAEILGVDRIGIEDDFFRLGGHSLLAIRVLSRIRTLYGVELELGELFAAPTVALLAGTVAAATGAPLAAISRAEPRTGALPLSFAQARLWFFDRLAPGSPLYNLSFAYRLEGELRPAALAAALAALVERHEALRTRFLDGAEGAGGPIQVVDPPAGSFHLPWVDLSALPEPLREQEEGHREEAEARLPFDLARGGLFRAVLLRRGARSHELLLTMHHIVSDGWSMGILQEELGTLYDSALVREPLSPLPPLPLQYADFALWQREGLSGGRLGRQLAYWRERLRGLPPLLDLPTDRPRPPVQAFRGAIEPLALGRELSDRLREIARRRAEPLFLTLLAGVEALLQRHSHQDDFALGTPFAGRGREELEHQVGFFVNLLALRADLAGDPSFAALTDRARAVALGAYAHGEVPFDRIVEELAPERRAGSSPLFQVVFVLQTAEMAPPRLAGLEVAARSLSTGTSKFDLTVSLTDTEEGLAGELEYDRALYDGATVRRWAGHLVTLLAGVAGGPEGGALLLSELPLLGLAERSALTFEWNDTGRSERRCGDVRLAHERFAEQARARPEALAVAAGSRTLTYGELAAASGRLARYLRTQRVGPEVPVAVCADRTAERVVALLAVLQAGGAFVPLDPAYPADRLAFLLADSGARLVLAEEEAAGRLPGPESGGPPVFRLDRDLDDLPEGGEPLPAAPVGPDHLAYLIYTSGSTGRPKGVAIPHRGLRHLIGWHLTAYRVTAEDRGTLVAGPAFDASVWELWPLLAAGAEVHIPDTEIRLSAPRLLRWWAEREITVAFLPTPLAEAVLEELEEPMPAGGGLRLRALLVGGDRLHRAPRPGTPFRLVNHYGPSEYSVVTTAWPVAAGTEAEAPPIGRPIDDTRVYVLDPGGEPVALGVAGELCVAGCGLARGYTGRPELTAERFLPEPWGSQWREPGSRLYRTGDLVRWLPGGILDFLGRIDHQVKIRGMRVELGEIESALVRLAGVREAAVLAEAGRAGTRLVAFAAPRLPPERGAAVRAALEAELPDYMVPSDIVWLEALPLTANGKVDRRALAALEVEVAEEGEPVAPRTGREAAIAHLFAELLGVERVGVRDDFFRLGGHSLLAVRLLSRVQALFGVDLGIRALFAAPTVEALARAVAAAGPGGAETPLVLLPRGGGEPRLPASFAQSRLWFLDRMEPGTALYSIPVGYRFRAALDPSALAASLAELVRRHESLRTRFAREAEGPVQVVDPPARPPLPVVDLSALPAERRRDEERSVAAAEALRPFDLETGPLFRSRLLRLDGEEWIVLLAFHHIVADGWSLGIVARELEALYAAALAGRRSPLPEPELQYADYAVWQRKWMEGERLAAQLAYWREELASPPEPLELPVDRPFPPIRSNRGDLEKVALGGDLSEGLAALARSTRSSPFMVQLAIFAALLQRLTGSSDFLIGTPTAGRGRIELERLIGFFVNTLVLRVDAAGNPAVRTLIERVRETAVGAFAHSDLPFERLVEAVAPERSLGRSPLFQVMFVLQAGLGATPPRLAKAGGEPLDLRLETAKFDLNVALSEEPGGVEGTIEYNLDVFDATTIRRLAAHWRNLATGAVTRPESRLSELPLLAPAERSELVVEWNATRADYPSESSIPALFREQAERTPEAIAVVEGERTLTYAALARRAGALARRLRAAGVGLERMVALAVERSMAMVVGMLAILEAGGAYAPLDPSYPEDRLAYLVADSRASLLLTRAELGPALASIGGSLPRLVFDGEGDADEEDEEQDAGNRPRLLESALGGDHLAYLIYTSGSTGRPKGVAVPHRGVVRLVRGTDYVRLGPETVLAQLANASFDATTFEVWGALLNGGAVAIVPQDVAVSPPKLAAELRRHKVTTLFLTTALFNQTAREAPQAFATLDDLLTGGEAADPRSFAEALRAGAPRRLLNVYGPTENTTFSTWQRAALGVGGDLPIPIGRPIANSQAYVLDRDLRPVPMGVRGALYVGGDGLARGYWHRPDLTAERFVPSPFAGDGGVPAGSRLYATGDLVKWLPDGAIDFLGRTDGQVKVRGFRIEPGEIEARLLGHPGIDQAAVLALPEVGGGQRLAAYVVVGARGGEPVEAAGLRAHLRAELPEYMVPSALVFLDALPLTANGKIDRKALAALEAAPQSEREYAPPETAIETLLAGIWSEALGVERIGRNDDFWDLGGHSLLATKVSARIAAAFDVEIPLRTLFQAPTLAALAQVVGEALFASDGAEDDEELA